MAFFYRWMLEQGFVGKSLLVDGVEELAKLQSSQQDYSALDLLLDFMDGSLIDEDFNQEGAEFADAYYEESFFSKKYGHYLADYLKLDLVFLDAACVNQLYYYIKYSEENYVKVKVLLDKRYQHFLEFKKNK